MDLSKIYPKRAEWVHKGNYGSLLVIAGSKFYSGSATLAAVAAARAGVDLVTVVAPARAADVAAHTMPSLITYPLRGDFLTSKHVKEILEVASLRRVNAVVIGCGLGRHTLTLSAVRKLIGKLTIPMVLDADALIAISQKAEIVYGKQVILTPHAAELAALLGTGKIGVDFEQRMTLVKQAATIYKAVVLLKGHTDIITDGDVAVTNNSGDPRMTKGGTGDTLAGIVGSLLARGVGLIESTHVGAFINGKAGEYAAGQIGEGMVATDLLSYISVVIRQFSDETFAG